MLKFTTPYIIKVINGSWVRFPNPNYNPKIQIKFSSYAQSYAIQSKKIN